MTNIVTRQVFPMTHPSIFVLYVTISNTYRHAIKWILYVLTTSFHNRYFVYLNCLTHDVGVPTLHSTTRRVGGDV